MTVKFEDCLVNLLRPLGTYDLRTGTINRGELAAYGLWLDHGEEALELTCREMNLTTAEDFGLERIEALLPYRPVCTTVPQRREALAALLRISGDSFTPTAINDTIQGCGVNARVEETGVPGYVKVYFPGVAGIPEGFGQLRLIIEEILPSHLDVTYVFWYNTWGEVGARHAAFGDAAATGLSWYGLAIEYEGDLGDIWS